VLEALQLFIALASGDVAADAPIPLELAGGVVDRLAAQ
jgi:hypothetical protein